MKRKSGFASISEEHVEWQKQRRLFEGMTEAQARELWQLAANERNFQQNQIGELESQIARVRKIALFWFQNQPTPEAGFTQTEALAYCDKELKRLKHALQMANIGLLSSKSSADHWSRVFAFNDGPECRKFGSIFKAKTSATKGRRKRARPR